ncbi:DMT family transporter [Flexibacterium corallicola]|uniref:DMT family transporter n=1 Tax=Flexibacterium corallicola TaxID=3037259 RepID=UPI00286FA2A5|nr:DMT family transporter [Pseudovibrio sp. M1P-2-3]
MLRTILNQIYNQPVLLLVITMMLWGINSSVVVMAVGDIGAFTAVFLQMVLASAALAFVYREQLREHFGCVKKNLGFFIIIPFFGLTLSYGLFYKSGHDINAINLGILQGVTPLFVLLGGWLMFRSSLTLLQVGGVILTVVGVIYVGSEGDLTGVFSTDYSLGDVLVLLMAFCTALYTLMLKVRPRVPLPVYLTIASAFAAIGAIPLIVMEIAARGVVIPNLQGLGVVVYMALIPGVMGQLLFMRGISLMGPERVGPFFNLTPVFSCIFAIVLLGEVLQVYDVIGLSLILLGIFVSEKFNGSGRGSTGAGAKFPYSSPTDSRAFSKAVKAEQGSRRPPF